MTKTTTTGGNQADSKEAPKANPNDSTTSEKKAPKDQKPAKVKELSGSIDESYKFHPDEDNMVHYELTDFSSPRPRDSTDEYKPRKTVVKTSVQAFVSAFAGNYEDGDAFTNVNDPCKILALNKYLDEEAAEEAWADAIFSATKNQPKLKKEYVKNLVARKKKLTLMGGNQICTKILHIPKNHPHFEFKEYTGIPEDCLFD